MKNSLCEINITTKVLCIVFSVLVAAIFKVYYEYAPWLILNFFINSDVKDDVKVFLYFVCSIVSMAIFHCVVKKIVIAVCEKIKKAKKCDLNLFMDTVILLAYIIFYSVTYHKLLPNNNIKYEFNIQVITVYFMIFGIVQNIKNTINNTKSEDKD